MAYVPNFERILKKDEYRALKPGSAGAPPPGVATGGAPSAAAPVAGNPQASSASGFVSFDQRLAANQGAADKMAGQVASDVRKGADKAIGGLSAAQSGFNTKMRAGSLAGPNAPSNSNAGGGTLAAAQGQSAPPTEFIQATAPVAAAPGAIAAKPAGSTITAAAAPNLKAGATVAAAPTAQTVSPVAGFSTYKGPGSVAASAPALKTGATGLAQTPLDTLQATGTDRDKSRFQYAGPNDLRSEPGWKDLEAQTRDADMALGLTRDNAGLQQLVEKAYPGARTAGGSRLDAALTGAAGGERFAQLRGQYGNLSKMLSDADTSAKAQADAARASTADAAAAYGKRADIGDAERAAAAKEQARLAEDERIRSEEKGAQVAGDQWMRDNGVSAMVQRAWIDAGRPALGPWLQQNAPELYKQYAGQVGQTGNSQGLQSTPTK